MNKPKIGVVVVPGRSERVQCFDTDHLKFRSAHVLIDFKFRTTHLFYLTERHNLKKQREVLGHVPGDWFVYIPYQLPTAIEHVQLNWLVLD